MRIGRREFREYRTIRVSPGGLRSPILTLDLEDYVAGAVAAETYGDWQEEAVKAQAVASRTFALYRLTHPRSRRYHALTTNLDQCFVVPRLVTERVMAIVAATRGEYLVDGSGSRSEPLKALFHRSCGGATDTPASVWAQAGMRSQRAALCRPCQRSPERWRTTVAEGDLRRAVRLPPIRAGLLRIEVVERTPSGRLRTVGVSSGKATRVAAAEQLRARLGYQRVRSARFEWTISPTGVDLRGVGDGHGVGLCQRGAHTLAAEGWHYVDIVGHYYAEAELVRARPQP